MSPALPALDEDHALITVASSPIHGHGVFARCAIAEGQYIGRYEGRPTLDDGMHVLWLWDENEQAWQGVDGENALRYLNHSDSPNADWDELDLYALRDIAPGEEITFDYGWDDDE